MRVIAGELARRRFDAPPGRDTRPTGDRVREALFQHLQSARLPNGFRGRVVLDLYAGSGALAFEALSRGATRAILVDQARDALRCLRDNVAALGLGDRVRVVAGALPRALEHVREPANLIFADPPYADAPLPSLAEAIDRLGLAADDCVLVYEHAAGRVPPVLEGWTPPESRSWGDTAVAFYHRTAREPAPPTA